MNTSAAKAVCVCRFQDSAQYIEMSEDDPGVVEELQKLHETYEAALISNNVPVLDALFWESPKVIRFGATENLYGTEALQEFRRKRPSSGLSREVVNLQIRAFGQDTGVTTMQFERVVEGKTKVGRQTQCWIRFAFGWRIVSAHVSFLP